MESLARVDPVFLTRSLVDIDSTTGRETAAGEWLAGFLGARGYHVTQQPVTNGRFNVLAMLGEPPRVALSTHFDCVPPFFPSREERGLIFGRGSCDAKGILAAQIAAAERVRASGESRFALLFVVEMLVALFTVHLPNGFFAMNNGYEFVLTLAAGALALAFLGAGAYGLDSRLPRRFR